MYLIDQELSAINQLSAIVAAISGYLCSKQFGQLCLKVKGLQSLCYTVVIYNRSLSKI